MTTTTTTALARYGRLYNHGRLGAALASAP